MDTFRSFSHQLISLAEKKNQKTQNKTKQNKINEKQGYAKNKFADKTIVSVWMLFNAK